MDEEDIRNRVASLDTTKVADEERAWSGLRPLGLSVVPYLAEFYPRARKWQGRVSLLFHCIGYARQSDLAVKLGLLALADRSYMVRYRACGLLAYSLRADALPDLEKLLVHSDPRTVSDAAAAIDAIRSRNHHYFIDRDHTGRMTWTVNDSDRDGRV